MPSVGSLAITDIDNGDCLVGYGFGVLKRRPWQEVTDLSDEKRRLIPLRISLRKEKRDAICIFPMAL